MCIIKTIEERLKHLRKNILELNQTDFAIKLNLKQNSIAQIESGKRNMSDRTISDICREFNVNDEWLRFGTGEIFKVLDEISLEEFAKNKNATDVEIDLFKAYLNLPKDLRSAFMDFVVEFGQAQTKPNGDRIVPLPYVARGGASGVGYAKQSDIDMLVESDEDF